jgi:kynurenine formamidase
MEETMKRVAAARGTFAAALLLVSTIAGAQTWQPPAESARCPSKWGAGDERGAANHMTPALVLNAARLIRTGEVIELGRVLRAGMPMPATRRFDLHTKRTFMNPQANQRGSNEEVVTTELGQVGTQFDGFAHQSHGDSLYNCFTISEVATRTGFTKLGIENVGTLMTRGVLIDVAGLKGVDTLPDAYEVTVQDVQQALSKQNLTLHPGDAVLIHTGWGRLWEQDNAPVEVSPNPDAQISLPVHQIMLVVNGIYLLENLKLDELAAKGAHEFAFVMQPLKIQGGTGSTVAPVAIR